MKKLITSVFAVVALLVTSFNSKASELLVNMLTPEEWVTFQNEQNGSTDVGALWLGIDGSLSATRSHINDYTVELQDAITFGTRDVNSNFQIGNNEFFFTGFGTAISFPGIPLEAPNLIVIDLQSLTGLNLTGEIGANILGEGVYLIHNQDWSPISSLSMRITSNHDFQENLTGAGIHLGMYNMPVPEPSGGILAISLILCTLKLHRKFSN